MLSSLEIIKDIHSNIFNNKHGTKKNLAWKRTCVIFQAPPFFWVPCYFLGMLYLELTDGRKKENIWGAGHLDFSS